jgi:hypothetical protein
MKGKPERQAAVYHTFNVEDLIEAGHPLRPIKRMVDRSLAEMSRTFKAAYSDVGRPGVRPRRCSRRCSFSVCTRSARSVSCAGG